MMEDFFRKIELELNWAADDRSASENQLRREWILTNGLGGYASGTLSGVPTRRYHGLLISSLPAPLGRLVYFNHLSESVQIANGQQAFLSTGLKTLDRPDLPHFRLTQFKLEAGLPIWKYELDSCIIERRIMLVHRQNTVLVTFKLLSGPDLVTLTLQPSIHFRPHESRPNEGELAPSYSISQEDGKFEIRDSAANLPPLRLHIDPISRRFVTESAEVQMDYCEERNRGYRSSGPLWTPGYFEVGLVKGDSMTLSASTESWETIFALRAEDAFAAEIGRRERLMMTSGINPSSRPQSDLVLAADKFIIVPAGRSADSARLRAAGEDSRSVIAGYHWFTDWGRDTMISLEGLALDTGRKVEARWILHTFAHYFRRGLIPNLFPEGEHDGLYHTADATLWFFHAVGRYLKATEDYQLLQELLPKLRESISWHIQGTDFGIGVDLADGLLRQGAEGYQLTWMDAKVEGWVVTPRRGKTVEINALWYNALKLMQGWLEHEGELGAAEEISTIAQRVYQSFNAKFWNQEKNSLFDIVEGEQGLNDDSCRPNQLFAISLDNPVLEPERWADVLSIVEEQLLTPVGLRSLSRDHPDYKPTYTGDLRSRDAAYHQGTVWAWLIGPFVDAWLKVNPGQTEKASNFLAGFQAHLLDAGVGTISEIFDAEPPFTPRGCIAQAWSVAEVLRCIKKTGNSINTTSDRKSPQ